MPEFSYISRNSIGKVQRGLMNADSLAALRSRLESQGDSLVSAKAAEQPVKLIAFSNPLHRLPPRSISVEVALEQIALMLESRLAESNKFCALTSDD